MCRASRLWLLSCVAGLCACAAPAVISPKTTAPQTQTAARVKLDTPSVLADEPLAAPESPAAKTTQPTLPHKDKTVRVLVAENSKSIYVKHSGRINVYTQDKSKKYKISQPGTISIKTHKNNQVQAGTLIAGQPIIVEPVNGTTLEMDKNKYTGKFVILPGKTTFNIVEYVSLEQYLYGVLPYEMHPTWAPEALKAQAVAARTYTLKSIEKKADEPFDLYSDVRSQVYKGGGQVYDSVKKAVDQTRGEVLSYKGELFFTYYHGNCGGGTDHVHIWNPKAPNIKPLGGASCKFDSHSKSFTWKQDIAKSTAEKFARSQGLKGTLKSVRVAKKTGTGRAVNLTLKTTSGSKTVSCANFRTATGIRSCKLTKITTGASKVHIQGHGYGHGIGMCQDGAHGMAKQNYTYKQILKHYYPGSTLSQVR